MPQWPGWWLLTQVEENGRRSSRVRSTMREINCTLVGCRYGKESSFVTTTSAVINPPKYRNEGDPWNSFLKCQLSACEIKQDMKMWTGATEMPYTLQIMFLTLIRVASLNPISCMACNKIFFHFLCPQDICHTKSQPQYSHDKHFSAILT